MISERTLLLDIMLAFTVTLTAHTSFAIMNSGNGHRLRDISGAFLEEGFYERYLAKVCEVQPAISFIRNGTIKFEVQPALRKDLIIVNRTQLPVSRSGFISNQ